MGSTEVQSFTVSVVIPIYNVERYLEQCLSSVTAQSHTRLEIICVDDGSTDRSAAIARQMAAADDRIRLIQQVNQGLSAARNNGLAEARGDYVFFLDSDDWLAGHAIEFLLLAASQTGCAAVSGAVVNVWEATGEQTPYTRLDKRKTGYIRLQRQDFFALEPVAWNKLYQRAALGSAPFTPGLVHEDLDFYWRFFAGHPLVYAIEETVIFYRRRDNSLSSRSRDAAFQEHFITIADNSARVVSAHPQLRLCFERKLLKYAKLLRKSGAPAERYLSHIFNRYGVAEHGPARWRMEAELALDRCKTWLLRSR